jgi:SP family xylose:H+ symportor-like MFS transporter
MKIPPTFSLMTGLTLIATLGGLLFGYDTAVISGAIGSIDANFIDPQNLEETAKNSLSGLTISSALFGCILGGAMAGKVADWLGRKPTLMLSAIFFLICSIGSAFPELGLGPIGGMGPDALIPFNVYRIIGGIGVGMASLVSPLYIAEIAPKEIRGRLVSWNQIAIIFGMVVVYFVNWAIASLGDEGWLHAWGWRWMFASETIPSLIFAALLLKAPDTPRWLVMKGRDAQALGVLVRLGGDDPKGTLAEIEESLVVRHEKLFAFGGLVLFVGILLSVFQQLIGINSVLYYAPVMFKNMGASTDTALLNTLVVGVFNVTFTLVATLTVDRLGRKPLMLAGAVVMAIAMFSLGSLFYLNPDVEHPAFEQFGVLALCSMLLYIAGFAFSWGPIVWVLLSEIFPNAIKGKALGIAVAAQWIANLLVSWSFKVLDGSTSLNASYHHAFAYWVYGVMSVLAALFVWRWVPETKGRSLEAIQELWRKKVTVRAVAKAEV